MIDFSKVVDPLIVIQYLEGLQPRATREFLLYGDLASRRRLQEIEDDIERLRERMKERK